MEMVPTMCQKVKEYTYVAWVHSTISTIIYIFARKGSLIRVFLEVGPSYNLGVLIPKEDKIIFSDSGECHVPLYECTFLNLGLQFPFNDFKVEF